MSLAITSRRYLGNKASIAPWIFDTVIAALGRRPRSFADVFAGTGSVAWTFNHANTAVVANDLLYSNYVCLHAWLSPQSGVSARLRHWVRELNSLPAKDDNYVSENFGNRYWSMDTARQIGSIREHIEQLPATHAERCILIAALLYAADRNANTCGHYDAYRQTLDRSQRVELRLPELQTTSNAGNVLQCADANQLIRTLQSEVVYLDPPYNSRQYSDTYHVLENLARWEKPPLYGVARKIDRRDIKSRYCMRDAAAAFEDLVRHVRCRLLVVSYNNMGTRGDPRSNACIDDDELLTSLSRRGRVTVQTRDFKAFNAGKRLLTDHQERLFVCDVRSRIDKGKPHVESNRAFHGSGT